MQNFLKALFFLFIFLLVLYASIFFVFNSPKLTARIAQQVLSDCTEIQIRNVDYSLDNSWVWDDVTFQCTFGGEAYKGAIREIVKEDLFQIFLAQKPLSLNMRGVAVRSSAIEIKELTLHILWNRMDDWQGEVVAQQVEVKEYKITRFKADLVADRVPQVIFKSIQGDFYDGQLEGEIFLEYTDKFPYHMNVSVKQANLDLLDDASQAIFGSIHGFVDIQLYLRGNSSEVKKINGALDLSEGSSMSALLVQFLLDYLPKGSSQKATLHALIQQEEDLFLDDAIFTFNSLKDDHLNGGLELKSKELNLDADVKLDINIEGGMKNIFNLLDRIGQSKL